MTSPNREHEGALIAVFRMPDEADEIERSTQDPMFFRCSRLRALT
jgi:hypothetical protein